MQVLGYYLKFETDHTIPPLCAVLSERGIQLVCFPYIEKDGINEVIDCLVLPELPLFLNVSMDVPTFTTVMVNRYLLVLLMLWTKQDARLYHDSLGPRERIVLEGAIKKSAVQDHIQSHKEKVEAQLKEEVEKRRKAEQQVEEMQKQIEALKAEKGNPEKRRKLT